MSVRKQLPILAVAGSLLIIGLLVLAIHERDRRDAATADAALMAELHQARNTGAKDRRIRYPEGSYPVLTLPDGRRQEIRSVLNISRKMRYGNYVWDESRIPEGPVWVRVDLASQMISVFRAGHEIGSAVILYGTDGKPTPVGSFPVLSKEKNYRSITYDAPMPYSLRLTEDGVFIHASDVREGRATHGCIGVPEDFARLLFAEMNPGDLVVILPPAAKGSGAAASAGTNS